MARIGSISATWRVELIVGEAPPSTSQRRGIDERDVDRHSTVPANSRGRKRNSLQSCINNAEVLIDGRSVATTVVRMRLQPLGCRSESPKKGGTKDTELSKVEEPAFAERVIADALGSRRSFPLRRKTCRGLRFPLGEFGVLSRC